MWPGRLVHIHFILLANDPEQICLPNCTYIFIYTSAVVYIYIPNITLHRSKKKQQTITLLTMLLPHKCQQQICPSNGIYMSHRQISLCVHIRHLCQYIYLISPNHNKVYQHKHWYTYISHYWHMTLKKMCLSYHTSMPNCPYNVVYM